jgi:hypothetical protein
VLHGSAWFWFATLSVGTGIASAEDLTPSPQEKADRDALGQRLPTARLLWVNDGKVFFSTIKDWAPQQVTGGGQNEYRPRWSPDGTKVVFERQGSGVYVMNADFSGKQLVLPDCHTADWADAGAAVTAIEQDGGAAAGEGFKVVKYTLSGGQTSTIHDSRWAGFNGLSIAQAAELHPAGRYVITFTRGPGGSDHRTYIVDMQDKKYISNSQMDRGDCSPGWSPDGKYCTLTARTSSRPVLKADFNASTGAVSSATHFAGMDTSYQYYIHGHRVSNDGVWLVAGVLWKAGSLSGNREIYCWEIGQPDSSAVRLTFDSGIDQSPSLHVPGGAVPPPAAPANLSANAVSDSAIDLAWQDKSSDETGFRIERKAGAGAFQEIATVGAGVTAYPDSGLQASTAYTYRVRAYNAGGNSGYSNQATATTDDPPQIPTTAITSPSSGGAELVEGTTAGFSGSGQNLVWYYELASGGGRVEFGTGTSASLTVPAASSPPEEITITLEGDGGTDQQIHYVVSPSQPSVTVLSPNGGELVLAGQVVLVRWRCTAVNEVTIFYSHQGGAAGTWQEIAPSVDETNPGWLAYSWTVPDTPSADCLVMIQEYLGDASDTSDAAFEIGADDDSDGLHDAWEVAHFGATGACAPGEDPDGDGWSNLEEFAAGTDPTDAASAPEDAGLGIGWACGSGAGAAWALLALAVGLALLPPGSRTRRAR